MHCEWFTTKVDKFRRLPQQELIALVFSRFVFGFGLGALLAAFGRRDSWKIIGGVSMALGTLLALPAARRILTEDDDGA